MSLEIISCGWPGVNYWPGRLGNKIQSITLHHMAGYINGSIATFKNPTSGTSGHRLISNDRIVQMVKDSDSAYGAGNWAENKITLNLEIEGDGPLPNGGLADFTPATIATAIQQCLEWCRAYGINPLEQYNQAFWNTQTGKVETHKVYRIHSHQEVDTLKGNTSCPGRLPVEYIRNSVAEHLGQNTPILPVSSTPKVDTGVPLPSGGGVIYQFNQDLVPGTYGSAEVKKLQDCMKKLGFYPTNIMSTGNYTPPDPKDPINTGITMKAVLEFQKSVGIMGSDAKIGTTYGAGWFGPATRAKLNEKAIQVA